MSSIARSGADSSRTRSGSVTPNTARRITSSVIACMLGSTSNRRPRGHCSIARSAAARITSA